MEDAFPELASAELSPFLMHRQRFILYPHLWNHANLKEFAQKAQAITPIKYFIRDASNELILNPLIEQTVPADQGGIYMFCVKPPHITDYTGYLMYIGRAQKTDCQNLKKRVKEYQKELLILDRPKVCKMLRLWKDFLYVKCIPFSDNNKIIAVEKDLINSFLPPCNSEIPNITLSNVIAAFGD